MQVRRSNSGVLMVSLKRGDMLRGSVHQVATDHGIVAATVQAIGALEDADIGFYSLERKEYAHKAVDGIVELTSLLGNITLLDDRPFLHAHVTLGLRNFHVLGGHLFDANVGVVVEMTLTPIDDKPLRRIMCDEIGLARWEPNHKPEDN